MTTKNLCANGTQPTFTANPVIVALFAVLFALIGCGGPSRGTVEYRIADHNKLARYATTAKDGEIRAAAVRNKNLIDQTLLEKIALEDKYVWARKAAAEKLIDPILLAKIAVEDKNAAPRAAAVRNIHFTDQTLLAKFALEGSSVGVRMAAAKKVTDSTVLAKVALEDKNWQIRRSAVRNVNLTDQPLFVKIAREDKDESVRASAAKRITNSDYVERLQREGIICCHRFNITFVPNDGSGTKVHKICANSRQDCINQVGKFGVDAQWCNWNWQDCD